ncbi:ParB/RepB/Spo0J family partition protein [Nocardia mexicana]|uniref:ParB family chromosome partitioning protein n=1 Tax=Nocardia mexicana TaxID=279262 RepID=A0A370GNL4_9NOCA|nr:ParB/Srx family N-terminal domain-containing protein [Nocardia mexicana]RDI45318.1 ParB family chromosome partitioning protein [Nocardia mexicana]
MSSTEPVTGTAVLDPATGITPDRAPADVLHRDPFDPGPAVTNGEESQTPAPRAEALWVRPSDLVIAENVRRSFDLTHYPEMLESIRQFGVLEALLVERQSDGALWVLDGQIRTLLALEAEAAWIPAWVSDVDPELPDNERRIRTTLMQMNVNHRRVPMTQADDTAAVALMLDLGASVTRVAKGLQLKRDNVKKAAAIGASPTAKGLADSRTFSLDQLEVIAEYERLGDTDAVEQLSTVRSFDFTYRAKRIARERRETRARLEASLLYAAYGFGVLADEPDTSTTDARFIATEQLETETGAPVTEDLIRGDAARWAVWVDVEENVDLVDRDSGDPVDPDTVDWDTNGDNGTEPAAGLRHADSVAWRDRWTPAYYLLADQLPGSGLRLREPEMSGTEAGGGEDDSPAARAERTRQAAAAAAAERELDRLERKRVRVLNTRGEAANERRREFLVRVLNRRKPPTQAAAFVAESLLLFPDLLKSDGAVRTARDLLGTSVPTDELATTAASATTQRAQVITLGLVLGGYETLIDKSLWRNPYGRLPRYLTFLAEVGKELATGDETTDYTLVDVEQAAAALIDYRHIDLDT